MFVCDLVLLCRVSNGSFCTKFLFVWMIDNGQSMMMTMMVMMDDGGDDGDDYDDGDGDDDDKCPSRFKIHSQIKCPSNFVHLRLQ